MTTLVTGAFGCIGARDHGIRRIIHLAARQVPRCRQNPPRGASINVTGTANVFEVVRASAGQVERVVYASSAAVFGAPSLYPPGPIKDDAPPRSATHYGVYKVANEGRRASTGRSTGSAPRASTRSRSTGPAAISGSPPMRPWP
jgi:nucleoside-diphosphate-sugar epimerase